jgi:hypothetical protein
MNLKTHIYATNCIIAVLLLAYMLYLVILLINVEYFDVLVYFNKHASQAPVSRALVNTLLHQKDQLVNASPTAMRIIRNT